MKKEKTAVEFLYEFVQLKLTNEQQMQFEGLFHQAKQMEKEQIIDAFMQGADVGDMFNNENRAFITDAEQYYESKYGKDENKA